MPAKLEKAVPQPMPTKEFKEAAVLAIDYVQEAFAASMEMSAYGSDARSMRLRPALVRK